MWVLRPWIPAVGQLGMFKKACKKVDAESTRKMGKAPSKVSKSTKEGECAPSEGFALAVEIWLILSDLAPDQLIKSKEV